MKASDRYMQLLSKALPADAPQRDRFLNDIAFTIGEICGQAPHSSFLHLCIRMGTPSKVTEEYLVGMDAEELVCKFRILRYQRRNAIVISFFVVALVAFLLSLVAKMVIDNSGLVRKTLVDFNILIN